MCNECMFNFASLELWSSCEIRLKHGHYDGVFVFIAVCRMSSSTNARFVNIYPIMFFRKYTCKNAISDSFDSLIPPFKPSRYARKRHYIVSSTNTLLWVDFSDKCIREKKKTVLEINNTYLIKKMQT